MASDKDGRVLLYVRLVSALRDKIRRGEWPRGTCIPSNEELCREYDVSRNTMRQALAVLRDEGVLESTRGRGTTVIGAVEDRRLNHAIVDAISDPLLENKGISIRVLDRRLDQRLPPALCGEAGAAYDSYVQIRKLHIHQGTAFGYIDIFIESEAYARLPRSADERQLLSRLLIRHAGVQFVGWVQETTIGYPDAAIAAALDYGMTQPVVVMRRQRFDAGHRIVLAGEYRFRADHFLLRTRGEGLRAPDVVLETVGKAASGQPGRSSKPAAPLRRKDRDVTPG